MTEPTAAARVEPPPSSLVQFAAGADVIDLAWGHPGDDLLPVDELRTSIDRALRRYGPDALNYGASVGPGPLIEWLVGHVASIDGRAPSEAELLVTAGASQGLDLVCTVLAEPGDVCLVPSPTYHLALGILRDHPLQVVPVAGDEGGLRPDALGEVLERLPSAGRRARLMYVVPTFGNPTGATLAIERRREVVRLAADAGLIVVEDDVYRELTYDAPPPPSLWAIGEPGSVVRLGSFSKTLAPGLRLGWLTADPSTVTKLADGGLLASGGGLNHLVALAAAEHAGSGAYAANVARLRVALAERRDALVAGLRAHLPGVSFAVPTGGYFAWVRLPDGLDARELLSGAERHGVGFLAGPTFAVGDVGDVSAMRLAFSRYRPDELTEATRRLGVAWAELAGGRGSSADAG